MAISHGHLAFALRGGAVEELFTQEQFVWYLDDLVSAILKHDQNLVIFRTSHLKLTATHFIADVSLVPVVGNLQRLEGCFLGNHGFKAADLCLSGEGRAVGLEEFLDVTNGVSSEGLEVLPGLIQFGLHLLDFLLMSLDVKEGNATDAYAQEHFDVAVFQVPVVFVPIRLKAFVNRLIDGLLCFAGFDFLVDPVFDEDADQGFEEQVFQ